MSAVIIIFVELDFSVGRTQGIILHILILVSFSFLEKTRIFIFNTVCIKMFQILGQLLTV